MSNSAARPVLHIVSAIMRRGNEIVMIRQAAAGEPEFWSVPSGRVEEGELVTEALQREVLEETGLQVVDHGHLAFVLQIDNRRSEQLHRSRGPGSGYHATVWTFEVESWNGELGPRDPDGFVSEARFVPVSDAVLRLEELEWQSVTVRYLRGEPAVPRLHLQRWHADGGVETIGSVGVVA